LLRDTAIEGIEKHGFRANGNTIPCVHGLRPANFTRRTLSLTAALAVPTAIVAAMLALAAPAQASPVRPAQAGEAQAGAVSVAVDSMNPQFAGPGATIRVTGTVSNATTQTKADLEVQLYTSPTPFSTRDQMDGYLGQGQGIAFEAVGLPFTIVASLRPGATAEWHAEFDVNSAGFAGFGVYPVTAQLQDPVGDVLASDQTLLPFWPGSQRAAGLLRPLDIAWVWPLIDRPHHQVCAPLTNNDLAASLGRSGRLSSLLTAGQAYPDADLTWVIDPALLGDVATMTSPYQVDSGSDCTGRPVQEPPSQAARTWLSALRKITSSQPTVITPYADADVTALVHGGLNTGLTSAYTTGEAVADRVLNGSFGSSIALPAGGTADLSVLAALATAEDVGTVVLDSNEMPPANSAVFAPDDAVTTIQTAAGTTMNVLLADHILTGVLQAGDTSSGVLPASTEFAVSQRFLAETAMIAAEAPHSDRSIVVAPPDGWSPSAALASELLSETVHAPWLAPTSLSSLSQSADSYRGIQRQHPPASRKSPGELGGSYLSRVSALSARLGVYQAMLYQPNRSYLQSLDEALAATESSAWRGSGTAQGLALADSLSDYLNSQEKKVKIIAAVQVSMGGASGAIPVSIQNKLHEPIAVRVSAGVVNSPDRTSQLTVGRLQKLVVVQPQEAVTVRLPVSSAPQGSTTIRLSLTSANGTLLPFATTSLNVQSTRYGRAILFLIGAAIGVLVLTSAYRGIRRWLHADADVADDAAPPGSVVTGTASARHPTEAPDDLADARRWADDA
jgi:Family of unknown function (DUF6049)